MAANEFPRSRFSDRVEGKTLLLRGDLRLHQDIDQEIAQLFLKIRHMPPLDGIDHFIRLLNEREPQGDRSLFAIPGTAAGTAQPCDNLPEMFHGGDH